MNSQMNCSMVCPLKEFSFTMILQGHPGMGLYFCIHLFYVVLPLSYRTTYQPDSFFCLSQIFLGNSLWSQRGRLKGRRRNSRGRRHRHLSQILMGLFYAFRIYLDLKFYRPGHLLMEHCCAYHWTSWFYKTGILHSLLWFWSLIQWQKFHLEGWLTKNIHPKVLHKN